MKNFALGLWTLLSLLLGTTLGAKATNDTPYDTNDSSQWSYQLAYQSAEKSIGVGHTVYALFNGNLLAYNGDDGEVKCYDKLTGMSDKGIVSMGYSDTQHCLVLLYANNNIDLLYPASGEVINLPQIKNFIDYSITTTKVNVSGDWAVVSAKNGATLIDLKKASIRASYNFNIAVRDGFVVNDMLCIATDEGIYLGNIYQDLYNLSTWNKVFDYPCDGFVQHADGAYAFTPLIAGKTEHNAGFNFLRLGEKATDTPQMIHISPVLPSDGTTLDGLLYFTGKGYLMKVDPKKPYEEQARVNIFKEYAYVSATTDGKVWVSDGEGPIRQIDVKGLAQNPASFEPKITDAPFGGYGPVRDRCENLRFINNCLYVSGERYETATGTDATVMTYKDGNWRGYGDAPYHTIQFTYRCAMTAIPDVDDPLITYVATPMGVIVFRDYEYKDAYTIYNSTIEGAIGASGHPNYAIVNGLTFDSKKNLWMTNYQVKNTLKVRKHDGTWLSIPTPTFTNEATPDQIVIDAKDRIWVASRRWTNLSASGLYCLDTKGTLDDFTDDEELYRSSAANEDGTTADLKEVRDMAIDLNGQLWVGCGAGVFAVTNTDDWFNKDFHIYQPKVPRNDGTNYADYLLNGIPTSAIAIDGANRKWLGTIGSGIYLASADGSEVIAHFTEANSPLLSDYINDLEFNPATGTLYIATDKGFCEYQTHVLPTHASLDKSAIKVYPNPVAPDYHGKVYVTGLTEGAQVKVLSASGQLVNSGPATGGTFEWDVMNAAGTDRVASGVYYLFISTADGSKSVSAKVAVI